MIMNRQAACFFVGVFVVAVVVYIWFQDTTHPSSSSSAPSSKKRDKSDISKQSESSPSKSKMDRIDSSKLEETKDEEEEQQNDDDEDVMDEGVIKYNPEWTKGEIQYTSIQQLLSARNRLHDLKLIHVYKHNNIGFGNISQRIESKSGDSGKINFYITGTQTSGIDNDKMNESHFCKVTDYDIAQNKLSCYGPICASSESMTHATIYELDENIKCVVHIHHNELWRKCMDKLATTDKNVAYGTPEMAKEVKRLFVENIGDVRNGKVFVMGGHEDGLISFGETIEDATNLMIETYQRFCGVDVVEKEEDDGVNGDGIVVDEGDKGVDVESIEGTVSGEDSTTTTTDSNENNGNGKNMNINIIDDYATPVLTAQIMGNEENKEEKDGKDGGNKSNGGFVQIESDQLTL